MLLAAMLVVQASKPPVILQRYFERIESANTIFVHAKPRMYWEVKPQEDGYLAGGGQRALSDLVIWHEKPRKIRCEWFIWNGDRGVSYRRGFNAFAPGHPKTWEDASRDLGSPIFEMPSGADGEKIVWSEDEAVVEGKRLNTVRFRIERKERPWLDSDITWCFDKDLALRRVQYRSESAGGIHVREQVIVKLVFDRKFGADTFDLKAPGDREIKEPDDFG